MTRYTKSKQAEAASIAELQRVCAEVGMILRLTPNDDVGLDAQIEVVEKGMATGVLIGVQLKSTAGSAEGKHYRFIADRDHFGYWARCSLPVIGVVHNTKWKKAVWIDLTAAATYERIKKGPYTIRVEFDENETAFTPSLLMDQIVPRMLKYVHVRHTTWEIRELLQPTREHIKIELPIDSNESELVTKEREQAWVELVQIVFDSISTDEEVADAGYRLSWYFTRVSDKQQEYVKDAFQDVNDFQLLRLIRAIHTSLENNADPVAELILDLLAYVPNIIPRIEELILGRKIPSNFMEAAIQSVEYLDEGFRQDLRDAADYNSPYGASSHQPMF